MILIDDDFVIDVDINQYIVKFDRHKTKTNKSGEEIKVFDTLGYYSRLDKAIRGVIDFKVKKMLSEGEKSLEEALLIIEMVTDQIDEKLSEVINGN